MRHNYQTQIYNVAKTLFNPGTEGFNKASVVQGVALLLAILFEEGNLENFQFTVDDIDQSYVFVEYKFLDENCSVSMNFHLDSSSLNESSFSYVGQ